MRVLRFLAVPLAFVAILLAGGPAALAADGATTSTEVERGTFVNPGEALPCVGNAPYVIVVDYVAVDHRTSPAPGASSTWAS